MSLSLPPSIPPMISMERVAASTPPDSRDLSFRQVGKILRKRHRTILISVGGALSLAILASAILPHKYASVTTVEVLDKHSDPYFSQGGSSSETTADILKSDLQTAIATFGDQQLGIEVIDDLNIEDRTVKQGLPFWQRDIIPADPANRLPLSQDAAAREFLLKKFEKSLEVRAIPDTRLITIKYKDRDPEFAARTANAVVDLYFKDKLARNSAVTSQASEWMSSQLEDLKKHVETSQQNLTDFQKRSGFIAVPAASTGAGAAGGGASSGPTLHSPILDRLLALNQNLVLAQNNRITQEALYRVAQTQDPDAVVAMSSTVANSPNSAAQMNEMTALMSLRAQQGALKQQLASSSAIYGAKNPHLVDLNQQISYLGDEIKKENARILMSAAGGVAMARASETALRTEVADLEHQANGLNDSSVRLSVLQQEADSTRTLYESLYTRLQESRIAEETQATDLSIVSRALPSAKPIFPNWPLNIAVGLGGGLFVGILLAFVRDSLDDTITTGPELEALTQVPVLAQIPKLDAESLLLASRQSSNTLSIAAPESGVTVRAATMPGEAYRALGATLMLSRAGAPPHTLLVSSALPAEGKTTTVYNLAACLAQNGKRVLAIDADMRKPALKKRSENASLPGLSTLLTSSIDPKTVIIADRNTHNLFLLVSGPTPPNPTELLGSLRFSELMAQLRKEFDHIIIDAPPAMFLADTSLMAPDADGVLGVVRSGKSNRPTVVRFVETMRRNKANLIGFVLNDVDTKSPDFYEAYGYYGSIEYGKYATKN